MGFSIVDQVGLKIYFLQKLKNKNCQKAIFDLKALFLKNNPKHAL
jgi:hypothetical protein